MSYDPLVLKLLAGALLVVGVVALVLARWVGFEHDTGDRWLVGVGVSAACILLAVALLRLDVRRTAGKTTQ